jgi:hypothetical protein
LTINSQFENIINGEGVCCKMEKKVLWNIKKILEILDYQKLS